MQYILWELNSLYLLIGVIVHRFAYVVQLYRNNRNSKGKILNIYNIKRMSAKLTKENLFKKRKSQT